MSVISWDLSRLTMCSIIGTLISGTIGFGILVVNGRSRVPNPPAIITALFIEIPRLFFRKMKLFNPNEQSYLIWLALASVLFQFPKFYFGDPVIYLPSVACGHPWPSRPSRNIGVNSAHFISKIDLLLDKFQIPGFSTCLLAKLSQVL